MVFGLNLKIKSIAIARYDSDLITNIRDTQCLGIIFISNFCISYWFNIFWITVIVFISFLFCFQFDPALQRYISMLATQGDYWRITRRTIFDLAFTLTPFFVFGYFYYQDRVSIEIISNYKIYWWNLISEKEGRPLQHRSNCLQRQKIQIHVNF